MHAQRLSAEDAASRTIHRRAIEAVVWGMPAVNTDLMLQEMLTKTDGKVNQIIYWGRPLDYRNQTLTPNPDAIYFMAFFNTKEVASRRSDGKEDTMAEHSLTMNKLGRVTVELK